MASHEPPVSERDGISSRRDFLKAGGMMFGSAIGLSLMAARAATAQDNALRSIDKAIGRLDGCGQYEMMRRELLNALPEPHDGATCLLKAGQFGMVKGVEANGLALIMEPLDLHADPEVTEIGRYDLARRTYKTLARGSVKGRWYTAYCPKTKALAVSKSSGSRRSLFMMGSGETRLRLIETDPEAIVHPIMPVWNPEGTRLAFSSLKRAQTPPRHAIFELDLQTMRVSCVASGENNHYPGTYSPDGAALAFSTDRASKVTGRDWCGPVWTVDLRSGQRRQVPGVSGANVAWHPTSDWLLFSVRAHGANQREFTEIWASTVDGSRHEQITSGSGETPHWCQDGTWFAFTSYREFGQARTFRMNWNM